MPDVNQLRQIFTEADEEDIFVFWGLFVNYAENFDIDSEFDRCAFLAQVLSEVGPSLKGVRENLNYSCDALISTFSYYSDNRDEAYLDGRCDDHEADQVKIGNKAYANRLGNGDISTGDGYRYRGGGFFQLTGKGHYSDLARSISERTEIDVTPEILADNITHVFWGLLSAMAFWQQYCDHCFTIDCTTEAINYYTDSYQKRRDNYDKVCSIL
jgi:putative chitinase